MKSDSSPALVTLGDRIRAARVKRNLSQPMLAKLIEVSPGIISQWENGLCTPKQQNLLKLSKVLGVDSSYLFDGKEPHKTEPMGKLEQEAADLISTLNADQRDKALKILRVVVAQLRKHP
jgi:transcriptional regulator with XRE-family HTH domain